MSDSWSGRAAEHKPSRAAAVCTAIAARAVADCNELFVGGNASPQLLQLLAARCEESTEGATDVMASILDPDEPTPRVVFSARGPEALALLSCYWDSRPSAPLVLVSDGRYLPLHCSLEGKPWTETRLSVEAVARLQEAEDEGRIEILLPTGSSHCELESPR